MTDYNDDYRRSGGSRAIVEQAIEKSNSTRHGGAGQMGSESRSWGSGERQWRTWSEATSSTKSDQTTDSNRRVWNDDCQ